MNLADYQRTAFESSRIDWTTARGRQVAVLGVLGELGSLATVLKKRIRDGARYSTFIQEFTEESGDVLWYIAAIATHYGLDLQEEIRENRKAMPLDGENAHLWSLIHSVMLLNSIIAADDTHHTVSPPDLADPLGETASLILRAIEHEGLNVEHVLRSNIEKTRALFCDVTGPAPHRDCNLPIYEQLPRLAVIEFIQRPRGSVQEVLLRMNSLNIGDRLTDNSADPDGYRFHDALHLGYLAVLGWSPVIRGLLRLKRKSDKDIDEHQDGARAAIIEEAITQQIFSHAREQELFRGVDRLDYGLLKWVKRMVQGLEVADSSAAEWQLAILEGYRAFRNLKEHGGGFLTLNASCRQLRFSAVDPRI